MPDFDASDRQRKNDNKVVAPHSKTVRLCGFAALRLCGFAALRLCARPLPQPINPEEPFAKREVTTESWSKWGIEVKRMFVRWFITALDNWLRS